MTSYSIINVLFFLSGGCPQAKEPKFFLWNPPQRIFVSANSGRPRLIHSIFTVAYSNQLMVSILLLCPGRHTCTTLPPPDTASCASGIS